MELIKCDACGHNIALAAKSCPSCGNPNNKRPPTEGEKTITLAASGCAMLIFAFIGIPIIVGLIFLVISIFYGASQ